SRLTGPTSCLDIASLKSRFVKRTETRRVAVSPTVYQMGGMIILHGPVSPNSRTPETKPLPINRRAQNFGRRDDRPGDAGCTHTVSVGPERTNRPSFKTSRSSLWRFLDRHNITLKKVLQAAERQRADVARARRRWIREQGMLDPAR